MTTTTRFHLIFSIALVACADAGSALPPNLGCAENSDCDAALTCSFNHCIVPDTNRLQLAARIIPPPTSGLLPQQIPNLSLEDGPDRIVQLLAPTVVRGVVKSRGDALITNLEGELEVRTDGDIDGLDYVFSAHSLAGLDVDGYGYTLALLPGRSYTGTFRPSDSTLPRYVFGLEPSDIANGRFDITLPARGAYLKLGGRVMKRDFTAIGARVVVMSTNREVAAVTTSDADRGLWKVLVPPGLTSYLIKVESTSDGASVFPEFTTGPITYSAEDSEKIDLIVPDLPPGTEPIEAVIEVTERKISSDSFAPSVVAAVGRTVTIVGVLAGGTLRRNGVTDERGHVTFNTLPGAYECLVASPPQSSAATWHGFVNLASAGTALIAEQVAIELGPRVPFVGRITDTFGLPVEAGLITLERRVDGAPDDLLFIAPAPFDTELGPDGVFATAVDPGVYDVTVAPEPGTGAPNTFESDVMIGVEGLRFDLGLPPPGLLHLTVARPDGTWLPGAQVELWVNDEFGTPHLLAIGATSANGFVDLIVPHLTERGAALTRW